MNKAFNYLVAGLFLLLSNLPAVASSQPGDDHADHHLHKHHVSVFLGDTTNYKGLNAFTVGMDYEYRLNQRWGLVALADHSGGEIASTVVAVGIMLHPVNNFRVQAGPGWDFHETQKDFVVRLGFLYDFFVKGDWTISPSIYVDVLELDNNFIIGLGFGRGF